MTNESSYNDRESGDPESTAAEGVAEQTFGAFRIVRLIARGSRGSVFEARQESPIQRTVAVKVLASETAEALSCFQRERSILADLHHSNVPALLDAGADAASGPYFVLEYANGGSMVDYCQQSSATLSQRADLVEQLAETLDWLHDRGVCHGDICSDNVLVTERTTGVQAKLIDFSAAVRRKECVTAEEWQSALEKDQQALDELKSELSAQRLSRRPRPRVTTAAVLLVAAGLLFAFTKSPQADQGPPSERTEGQRMLLQIAAARETASQLWPLGEEVTQTGPRWIKDHVPALLSEHARLQGRAPEELTDVEQRILEQLDDFFDPDQRAGEYASVQARIVESRKVVERSLESPTARNAWKVAIPAIEASSVYGGLSLTPQEGLLPLGPNEHGLWEFLVVGSGEAPPPRNGPAGDGLWRVQEESGIVLILVPGGDTILGSHRAVSSKCKAAANGMLVTEDPLDYGLLDEYLLEGDVVTHCNGRPVADDGELRRVLSELVPGRDQIEIDFLRGKKRLHVQRSLPVANFCRRAMADRSSHVVPLDPFFISRFELTFAQWLRLADSATDRTVRTAEKAPTQPMHRVAHEEMLAVLRRVGLTLPTEAQWEHGARGGSRLDWWWGSHDVPFADHLVADFSGPPPGKAVPVDSWKPNNFGLQATDTNAFELCLDRYLPYDNPVRPGDGLRLGDGEFWVSRGAIRRLQNQDGRVSRRGQRAGAMNSLGMRPARAIELRPPQQHGESQ